jgi:hypothetical protein
LDDCLLLAVFLIIEECSTTFGDTFSHGKSDVLMSTKMGWATFWAIFSQTHLVTLAETILRSVLPQEWLKAGLNESILHWIRSLGRRACKMKKKCFSNKSGSA